MVPATPLILQQTPARDTRPSFRAGHPSPSREQLELLGGNVDLVVMARAVTAFREDRILRDGTTVVF
jgi:hypothetical protein